jgi:molybdopterin-synthase adenylyltransferase
MSGERYSRQSFLGAQAQTQFTDCVVGLVGLGGGGSHIAQQLAHLGFQQYVLFDAQTVDESNLNRLVGATTADVETCQLKVAIAERLIRSLQAEARIEVHECRWQDEPLALRRCDLVFGSVDGLQERRELEACTRRFLIPYIDIGLDVTSIGDEPPILAGQVVLSMPGDYCMRCMGMLTERALADEVSLYGQAGPHPQVVWANGVLASTAIGIAVDLLTDWTRQLRRPVYLIFEGNTGKVNPAGQLAYLPEHVTCSHFPLDDLGDVIFP